MKTLRIPLQNISHYETLFNRIQYLNEGGAEAAIDQVNWTLLRQRRNLENSQQQRFYAGMGR